MNKHSNDNKISACNALTKRIRVYGIVQGVGFRPTVSRHAKTAGIRGTVCNKGPYVEIIIQGTNEECERFLKLLNNEPPKRAFILKIDVCDLSSPVKKDNTAGNASNTPETSGASKASGCAVTEYKDFSIIESEKTSGAIYISPDIAICDDCKRELFDKNDRRCLHPFINCTNCGPRMTILDALPYDRERTSMKIFPMCGQCSAEYHSPLSRRYDAQPVCCNECGPKVYVLDKETFAPSKELTGSKAITLARKTVINGGIIAVKGIGGFHLCCDATNENAVGLLRTRKHRPMKPFAVMARDIEAVKRECLVTDNEETLLTGHQKPIVLLHKKISKFGTAFDTSLDDNSNYPEKAGSCAVSKLAEALAPDNPKLGVMLPYAPIQLLLFDYDDGLEMPDFLVMTSANESGAPICRDDKDALNELSDLADVILSNDRLIRVRADDTVTDFYKDEPYMIRRSRGFAPLPILMNSVAETSPSVIGIGGELKNSFCIGRGQLFYPSPYVGDLGDIRTVDALKETVKRFLTLLEAKPTVICCDMHPLYQSRELAYELADELSEKFSVNDTYEKITAGETTEISAEASTECPENLSDGKIKILEIQHHYAHILSCMAENDYDDKVIGVSFDGTGYGTDKTIWGGEILICGWNGFERVSHISPFMQVGGDSSSREGWRIASWMVGDICGSENIIKQLKLCSEQEFKLINMMASKGVNAVKSTSAGRLFDAVSAILGIRRFSSFEGEASTALMYKAMEYENAISSDKEAIKTDAFAKITTCYKYPLLSEDGTLNTKDLVRYIVDELLHMLNSCDGSFKKQYENRFTRAAYNPGLANKNNTAACDEYSLQISRLAYIFHKVLADMITASVTALSKKTGIKTAALSGGVFQNTLLLKLTEDALIENNIKVLRHHLIPPNDGGIGLGQAVYAAKHL